VAVAMTAMSSRHLTEGLALSRRLPGGRCKLGGLAGLHRGQAREHVHEVFAWVDAQAATVGHDGIKHCGGLPGFLAPDEEPALRVMQTLA